MEGTFLQSVEVLVGAPSRRIYSQSSISLLQHYLLVVTKIYSITKVGGVDYKAGIVVNFTLLCYLQGTLVPVIQHILDCRC